jgi:predicted CXXCH cytochrome family protein
MSLIGIGTRSLVVLAAITGLGGSPALHPAYASVHRAQDTTYSCLVCHADKRRSFSQGVHSERGIRCDDCHGGNPRALETADAHRGTTFDPGNKIAIAQLCSSCHSDPNQMRQYGLPAGELAEFRTSRHGQVLLQGNEDAPTCTDCHDAHTILRSTDARSTIYPTNIPATCAACHEDTAMMQKYGLPTDQIASFRAGAHGVAVFEEGNFAAPTCVGCHGSHSALPPAATEISTVCDRCHALLGAEFHNGPHGRAASSGRLPGCLACHSNHGTETVAPEEIAGLCAGCHPGESREALMGVAIQTQVVRARDDLALAERAIEEMTRQGLRASDAKFRYESALTEYREIAKVQHSLDLELLADLARRVGSDSREVRETAEVSRERRWEHRLMLVPVWFLALSAIVLAGFRLAKRERPDHES